MLRCWRRQFDASPWRGLVADPPLCEFRVRDEDVLRAESLPTAVADLTHRTRHLRGRAADGQDTTLVESAAANLAVPLE
jgi:hypothetical protein